MTLGTKADSIPMSVAMARGGTWHMCNPHMVRASLSITSAMFANARVIGTLKPPTAVGLASDGAAISLGAEYPNQKRLTFSIMVIRIIKTPTG